LVDAELFVPRALQHFFRLGDVLVELGFRIEPFGSKSFLELQGQDPFQLRVTTTKAFTKKSAFFSFPLNAFKSR
jgi:hypothetical protein